MENIFFINHKSSHKIGLLKLALEKINQIITQIPQELQEKIIISYTKIFNYIDFDTFAKIKELYSSSTYKFLPTWESYFQSHGIIPKYKQESRDPIRLIFSNIPTGISYRDYHLISTINEKNKNLLRKPFFINIGDIDYAGYFKLLKYLILKFYNQTNKFNASKLSNAGKRAALETNQAFILYENRKLKSIKDCIINDDDDGLKYLVEEIGLKPTEGQMKIIEKKFSEEIYDFVSYYFE